MSVPHRVTRPNHSARTLARGLGLSIENSTEQVNAAIAGRQGFWRLAAGHAEAAGVA